MAENELQVEKKGNIGMLILNRPERRNALSPYLLHQLAEALEEFKKEDEIRCVVIKGAGDKAFSSGYDIGAIPTEVSPRRRSGLSLSDPCHDQRDGLWSRV
jgi:enoyl-CoA hydratase